MSNLSFSTAFNNSFRYDGSLLEFKVPYDGRPLKTGGSFSTAFSSAFSTAKGENLILETFMGKRVLTPDQFTVKVTPYSIVFGLPAEGYDDVLSFDYQHIHYKSVRPEIPRQSDVEPNIPSSSWVEPIW